MDHIKYAVEGAVALIQIDRPPVNALSTELAVELGEALGYARDETVRAVLIWGEPHFAAGADIKDFEVHHRRGSGEALDISLRSVIRELEQLAKPTMAAVFGYALGGGLELAMGADFRYLAQDAQVGQPEIKLGIIPGAGGTQRLTRLVGVARARDIIYSGRFVSAEEALEIGLATKVVPRDDLLAAAREDAARWAEGPTLALAAAKRAINEGWGRPIDEALDVEIDAFNEAFWTEDAKAGVEAFLAKRDPLFRGR